MNNFFNFIVVEMSENKNTIYHILYDSKNYALLNNISCERFAV